MQGSQKVENRPLSRRIIVSHTSSRILAHISTSGRLEDQKRVNENGLYISTYYRPQECNIRASGRAPVGADRSCSCQRKTYLGPRSGTPGECVEKVLRPVETVDPKWEWERKVPGAD